MSSDAEAERFLATLPGREDGGEQPVFVEPWHAQAFAMAVELHRGGVFSWAEWAGALSEEIATREQQSEDGAHYYECWLAALERLVVEKGVADAPDLDSLRESWRDAFEHTPHGSPVSLPPRPRRAREK